MWKNIKQFYLNRFARIWPTHVIALLLIILVIYHKNIDTEYWARLISNLFLVHAWIPNDLYQLSFNGPSWSISTEAFFYLTFPFIIIAFRKSKIITLILVIALASTPIIIGIYNNYEIAYKFGVNQNSFTGLVRFFPVTRLLEFFFGILAGYWFINYKQRKMNTLLEIFIVIIAISYYILLKKAPISLWVGHEISYWFKPSTGYIPLSIAIILGFANGQGLLSQWLSSKWMRALGESSFALYLLHTPIKVFFFRHIKECRVFTETEGILWFCSWALLCIVLSAMFWKFIETPITKTLKNYCKK